ncbi:MAG: FAD-dependent oxidoreductase [Hyphomicrobiales bacterium]|nr:FAD-dependent oxidoreductase [Hyphomicrobiales bacterium]
MSECDALIIGAGHNGLACAFYLARAGLRVHVVERLATVGGAAVTEEFHPGFRNSVAAYTVGLLHPRVIADMRLHAHGLKVVERKAMNFVPGESDYLLTTPDDMQGAIARLSPRDAAAWPAYSAEIDRAGDVLRQWLLRTPPNLQQGKWRTHWRDRLRQGARALRLGRDLAGLDAAGVGAVHDLFTRSAGDMLDRWFENDLVKALFGFDAVVGNYASPYTPGSAYVQLHHTFGEVNGRRGVWGHAIGGMGAITQAMAKAAVAAGAKISLSAPVREVIVEKGRACGVVLDDGVTLRAGAVVANVNPKLLYGKLVPDGALTPAFSARMGAYRCESATFRMNVALSELPRFSVLPGQGDHLTAGVIIAPSLRYMDRAYAQARLDGWSSQPIIEMLIPSTLDDTLAPEGAHVASLFCQHTAYELEGRSWDDCRETVADLMIATVDAQAPGFAKSVIARQALSPRDLEDRFGLVGGDIFHGALGLDQIFSARPVLGAADYRGPLAGLYHCGSGAHPGGGVTGAPGHNAAREIIGDMRARRMFGGAVRR